MFGARGASSGQPWSTSSPDRGARELVGRESGGAGAAAPTRAAVGGQVRGPPVRRVAYVGVAEVPGRNSSPPLAESCEDARRGGLAQVSSDYSSLDGGGGGGGGGGLYPSPTGPMRVGGGGLRRWQGSLTALVRYRRRWCCGDRTFV